MTDQTLPPYRVTCGFPSKGGMIGGKTRTRGQCWSAEASEDGHAEIFISPVEDDVDVVAAILAHEMIHAALPKAGHNRTFQIAARAIGHEAPFTTAAPTAAFWSWARPLIATLPPYPHRRLNAQAPIAARKPQKNRQIKCECPTCGYIARTTRSWIEKVGPPHCPLHGEMVVERKEEEELEDAESERVEKVA
ncbi:MAG: transcription elongation protein SprT [Pseudomonadota bacterium]